MPKTRRLWSNRSPQSFRSADDVAQYMIAVMRDAQCARRIAMTALNRLSDYRYLEAKSSDVGTVTFSDGKSAAIHYLGTALKLRKANIPFDRSEQPLTAHSKQIKPVAPLKQMRWMLGLSRQDLAREVGVPPIAVATWEADKKS